MINSFEGVTVLNTYITNPMDGEAWAIIILSLLFCVMVGIGGAYMISKGDSFGVPLLITALFAVIGLGGLASYEIKHPQTAYEITISNEVNLNEFLDNFEIIDRRGEIYVVKPLDKIENP